MSERWVIIEFLCLFCYHFFSNFLLDIFKEICKDINTIFVDDQKYQICLEALDKALRISRSEIFNSDQGSQFTSKEFTGMLEGAGIQISMDEKGRVFDNIFIETSIPGAGTTNNENTLQV